MKAETNPLQSYTQYETLSDSKGKSILASTLNNFAAVSSSYGVIRPFNFIIKVKLFKRI